jgi:aspartokinase
LEIWTDVPGLFSADPRLTDGARLLRALTYEEAQEIATMGGKVLHPRAVGPARRAGVSCACAPPCVRIWKARASATIPATTPRA